MRHKVRITLAATSSSTGGRAAALWGIGGVLLLLGQAMVRLGPRALDAVQGGLSVRQWVVCGIWVLFCLYGEGYRAFHLRFSPRVVARALHLAQNPKPLHVVLAPFFCMALFHAVRRTRIVAWTTISLIVSAILLLRFTPQPWRGIVDAGVVLALLFGGVSLLYHFARALGGSAPPVPAQLPEP